MSIILTWKNLSTDADSIEVYRSTTAIDTGNPGQPLATLPNGTETYTDETAVIGENYFYTAASVIAGKRAFSKVKDLEALRRRGPGGQKILLGDSRLGYMGRVSFGEMPDMPVFLGASAPTSKFYATIDWHKFIRKNKIYFICGSTYGGTSVAANYGGLTYAQLCGIDSGIDWGDIDKTNWSYSGKNTKITAEGFTYDVRNPRGFRDDWDGVNLDIEQALDPETEFNELIQPLMASWTIPNTLGTVQALDARLFMTAIACAEQSPDGLSTLTRSAINTTSSAYNFVNRTQFKTSLMAKFTTLNSITTVNGSSIIPFLVLNEG